MSASSKKKLRKENEAAALTEKQLKEKAEAKKLKAITITFVAIMLAIVLIAVIILSFRAVKNSAFIDRHTVAAVTGTHELDSVQMNYYFTDYVRNLYQQWESTYGTSTSMYMSMMGLNLNAPLNEQIADQATGETWADHFLQEALNNAKNDYALYDKAMAEGFTLSQEEQSSLDYNAQMVGLYAMYSGYNSADKYLKAIYGNGADLESYNEYYRISTIANAYHNKYAESLTYSDAAIREYEKDKYIQYSSLSYALYNVPSSAYLQGGTKNDDGSVTYTDEEKAAALKAAEDAAKTLSACKDLDSLDKAIAGLEINANKENAASTKNDNVMYNNVPAVLQSWLSNDAREKDDITMIANETTSLDADGKEVKDVTGYYVVCFLDRDDNLRPLANVRHLLVKFEGGTTDANGNTTYTDEEKAVAKAEAERLLQVWKDGNATEDTFIELVKANSDDEGSAEEGGLIEDIQPKSNLVDSFRAWSLDVDRKVGDTGVIVSEYGYHVMYYSSDDELTYRDYMISEDLRTVDVQNWYNSIVNAASITLAKTNRLNLDLIIANIV